MEVVAEAAAAEAAAAFRRAIHIIEESPYGVDLNLN